MFFFLTERRTNLIQISKNIYFIISSEAVVFFLLTIISFHELVYIVINLVLRKRSHHSKGIFNNLWRNYIYPKYVFDRANCIFSQSKLFGFMLRSLRRFFNYREIHKKFKRSIPPFK